MGNRCCWLGGDMGNNFSGGTEIHPRPTPPRGWQEGFLDLTVIGWSSSDYPNALVLGFGRR